MDVEVHPNAWFGKPDDEVTVVRVSRDTSVTLPVYKLRKMCLLAGQDPSRRTPDKTVLVPVEWLVGVRVGY